MMRQLKYFGCQSRAAGAAPVRLAHAAAAAAVVALFALPFPTLAQTRDSSGGTGPISGYMEMHLNKPIEDRGTPEPKAPAVLDFHRFVLLFSHSFTPRLRFVGELELEHAVVEGLRRQGELELEQAYLDFLITPALNFRAGMLLVPIGIINERHEPPIFHGVERPFVDTVIIPTTWFDVGAGVHGTIRGKACAIASMSMAPLDAAFFTRRRGLRGGAQKGSKPRCGTSPSPAGPSISAFAGCRSAPASGAAKAPVSLPGSTCRRARRGRTPASPAAASRRALNTRTCSLTAPRRLEWGGGPADRDQPECRQAAARLLCRGRLPRIAAALCPRSRAFRALRELRHAVPHGRRRREACRSSIATPGSSARTYWLDPDVALKFDYSHVRSQSRHRAGTAIAQHRPRMVVLNMANDS